MYRLKENLYADKKRSVSQARSSEDENKATTLIEKDSVGQEYLVSQQVEGLFENKLREEKQLNEELNEDLYDESELAVNKELFKGKFGTIYAVKMGNKEMVLKKPNLTSQEKRNIFGSEVKFLKQFRHDNVVEFYGLQIGTTGDINGILIEPMEGDLEDFIFDNNKKTADHLTQSIMYQTYSALSYVHEQGMIHRDIKSANILVRKEGNGLKVKLCDFGLTAKTDVQGAFYDKAVRGTAGYLAPEIFTQFRYSPASDNFAGGCVFQELVTKNYAYPGNSSADVLENNEQGKRNKLPLFTNRFFKQIIQESGREDPELRPTAEENMNRLKLR